MSLDNCDELFNKIRISKDPELIADAYRDLFAFYPLVNYEIGRGSVYWRGRISDPQGFNKVDELSCPPVSQCTAGRLNHPGKACYYAATRRTTVLTEIHAKPGDYVHMVGVRFLLNKTVRLIAIGDLFHVYKTGYARSIGNDSGQVLSRMLNETDRELATKILYVDAFLSQILSDPLAKQKDYLPTRILAEVAYKKSGAKGMFYPSVQDHIGMNIAMLLEAYASNVHITTSQVVKVTAAHDFGFFDFKPLKHATGITEDGYFQWGSAQPDHHHIFFNLTKDEAEFASSCDGEDTNAMLDLMSFSSQLSKGSEAKKV